jgi:hypothetical protein
MTDVEARARLDSILSFLEHEADALHALGNPRLAEVLVHSSGSASKPWAPTARPGQDCATLLDEKVQLTGSRLGT